MTVIAVIANMVRSEQLLVHVLFWPKIRPFSLRLDYQTQNNPDLSFVLYMISMTDINFSIHQPLNIKFNIVFTLILLYLAFSGISDVDVVLTCLDVNNVVTTSKQRCVLITPIDSESLNSLTRMQISKARTILWPLTNYTLDKIKKTKNSFLKA